MQTWLLNSVFFAWLYHGAYHWLPGCNAKREVESNAQGMLMSRVAWGLSFNLEARPAKFPTLEVMRGTTLPLSGQLAAGKTPGKRRGSRPLGFCSPSCLAYPIQPYSCSRSKPVG